MTDKEIIVVVKADTTWTECKTRTEIEIKQKYDAKLAIFY